MRLISLCFTSLDFNHFTHSACIIFSSTNCNILYACIDSDLQYSAISTPSAALSQPLSADQKSFSTSKSRLKNSDHSGDNRIVNQFPAPLPVGGSRSAQPFSPTSLHQPSLSSSTLSFPSSNLVAPHLPTPTPVSAISSTSSSSSSASTSPFAPRPPPALSSPSSSSSRALEGKGIEGSTDRRQVTGDTSKQKLGFLDAIRGMDASTLR